jgi:hypothetical protein
VVYLWLEAWAVIYIIGKVKCAHIEITMYLISFAFVTLPAILIIIGIVCCTPREDAD